MKKLLAVFTVFLAGCVHTPPTPPDPWTPPPPTASTKSVAAHSAAAPTPASTTTHPTSRPDRPIPAIQRVLIISVDGLRPDLALRADTPVIHRLLKTASFTFWARTTAVAVTLPSHVSMLTGCAPNKHGIEWNRDLPFSEPIYPNVPTLFELAHKAGYSTAMIAGKPKFATLNKPGTIDWVALPYREPVTDAAVAIRSVAIIRAHHPQLLFVHLPNVDTVGHAKGWGTPEQLTAIADADRAIGKILAAERDEHLLDKTLVIITADHGGAGLSHGPDDPRSRTIPWIAVGPTIRPNYDLTRIAPLDVQTYDTFATACFVLGLHPASYIDGKPIKEIFTQLELLEPTTQPPLLH
jgi:hypothetical protein